MNLSKSFMLGTALTISLITTSLQAQTDQNNAPKSSKFTSTEIGTLATVAAIDKNEILLGSVAANKQNSSVSDFGKMMIEQHGTNLSQILELIKNQNITSLTGGEADKLTADGKKALLAIGGLQGDQFNKAYVDAMVKGHIAALNLIDQTLAKTAKSDELKKFLSDTRAAVVEHLDHAKKLQEQMKA